MAKSKKKIKEEEELEGSDLALSLMEKWKTTFEYQRLFTMLHYRWAILYSGHKPIEPYIKRTDEKDANSKNLIPEITTAGLASLVKKLRRAVVQGDINVDTKTHYDKDDYRNMIIDYIINDIILTDSTSNPSALTTKISTMFGDALAFAYAGLWITVVPNTKGGVDLKAKPVNYGDIFIEPDKDSIDDINWTITRLWYSKEDLEAMRGVWDDNAIDETLKSGEERKIGPTNKRADSDLWDTWSYATQVGYPVCVYQDKNEDNIVYFSPRSQEVLFEHPNYDKTGAFRLKIFVNEADSQGALGHSLFERMEAIQIQQDHITSLAAWQAKVELDPALFVAGDLESTQIKMRPGSVNYGMQGASIAPVRGSNAVPQSVAMTEKMLSGIITNATGVDDMSIPAASSIGSLSKTDTGVKQQQAQMDIVVNEYSNRLKVFLADYVKTAFNVYVTYAKAAGIKKLYIADRYKLSQMPPEIVYDDGTIDIDFSELQLDSVAVRIGPEDFGGAADKMEALRDLLNIINSAQGNNPVLVGTVKSMIRLLNLEDENSYTERIEEWLQQTREKEALNQEQQKLQVQQMTMQLKQSQMQMQMEAPVSQSQAQEQLQLQPLKTQADQLQLQAQIAQMEMQLKQMQQQMQNPQSQLPQNSQQPQKVQQQQTQ